MIVLLLLRRDPSSSRAILVSSVDDLSRVSHDLLKQKYMEATVLRRLRTAKRS